MKTTAALLALLASCSDAPPAADSGDELRCEPAQQCISDPWSHCVSTDGCRDDTECPAGLICASEPVFPSRCGTASPSSSRCRWLSSRIDRFALVDGFEVPTMALDIADTSPLHFTWSAPATAEHVACGVFTSNPVIAPGVDDRETIANAAAAIIDFQAVDVAGRWLSTPTVLRPPHAGRCAEQNLAGRVLELSAIGCWAYSSYSIVAASELHWIDPARVGLPADAGCPYEGAPCYERAKGFFGLCDRAQGTCAPRCTTAVDCELAAYRFFATTAPTCEWACQPIPGSHAGVCVHLQTITAPGAR
jgi:hypothetical protein